MTTGEAGMVSQVVGLAEAVGLPFVEKTVRTRPPWSWLPGHRCPGVLKGGLAPGSDPVAPPWPELLITCGRRSAAVSIAVGKASQGRTFRVHVQNPHTPLGCFDLITPPRHDRLEGANVIATRGALHRASPGRLAGQAEKFARRFAHLPRPLVAVLIGGDSRNFRLTAEATASFADKLAALSESAGAGLMVTTSRRTGAANEAIVRRKLEGTGAYIWDGNGENPYFAMLGLAEHIVVTGDSVSMVSEAGSTGKPVYVVALEGGSARFSDFHRELEREGVTRPFTGELDQWTYKPVNDTLEISQIVRHRLQSGNRPAAIPNPR